MISKLISTLLATSVALSPIGASAQSHYFFRYQTELSTAVEVPPVEEEYGAGNDIHAYYTLPAGRDFAKRIPVATHDVVEWRKDSGALPEGIALQQGSGQMTGRPTTSGKSTLLYHGYDAQGHRIARAELNFTVFEPVGIGAELALYAHSGQYFYHELPAPQGVDVYRWVPIDGDDGYPAGMSMMNDAFQGTPGNPGTFGVGWIGYDFVGRQVAYASGEFLVEDGPVVDHVADQSIDLQRNESFSRRATVQHKIGQIRYQLVAETPQPFGLLFDAGTGAVSGTYSTFDTSATFHIVATDLADGTVSQPSNSFTLSTKQQSAALEGLSQLQGYLHVDFYRRLATDPLPADAKWTLVSGRLPDGVALDPDTGVISGRPTTVGSWPMLVFQISGTGIQPSTNKNPATFVVLPQQVEGFAQPLAVRTGTAFSTKGFTVTAGKVDPMTFAPATPSAVDPAMTIDSDTGAARSNGVATAGSYGFAMIATNADGSASKPVVQAIEVYNPLSIAYADDVHVKRLAPLSLAPAVADKSVVGKARYELDPGSAHIPGWMTFDANTGRFAGVPADKSLVGQTYGPFVVRLSDESGDPAAASNAFNVTVDERDPLRLEVVNGDAERFVDNQKPTLKVSNAFGTFHVALSQGSLSSAGSTLSITDTGVLVGRTADPLGTVYTGLVANVTDADDAVGRYSTPFAISVVNPTGLKPLAGSTDVSFTWTKALPLPTDKVLLPLLSNALGNVTYAFKSTEPSLTIFPATVDASGGAQPAVSGTMPEAGKTTHDFQISDESGRSAASGVLRLEILDAISARMPDVSTAVGSSVDVKAAVSNAVGTPAFGPLTGAPIPSFLTFDQSTGTAGGVPRESDTGDYGPFSFTVTDPITGLAADPPPSFSVHVGDRKAYSVSYGDNGGTLVWNGTGDFPPTVAGAVGPVSYVLASNSAPLPPGAWLNEGKGYPTAGWISGNPQPGLYPGVAISATDLGLDANSPSDDRSVSVPLTLLAMPSGPIEFSGAQFAVRKNLPFSGLVLSAINTVESPTSKTRFEPTSDDGLGPDVILSSDGRLSGTLPDVGRHDFDVTVKDALFGAPFNRPSTSGTVTIDVKDLVSVDGPSVYVFEQYSAGSVTLTSTNVVGGASWSLPAMPGWLSATQNADGSITLSGTPEEKMAPTNFVFSVNDDVGPASQNFTLELSVSDRKPLRILPLEPATVEVSGLYGHDLPASTSSITTQGGIGALKWGLAGTLPPGVAFDSQTGSFHGTPTEYGDFPQPPETIVVTATDSKGGTDSRPVAIHVLQDGTPITIAAKQQDTKIHIGSSVLVPAPTVSNGVGTLVVSTTGLSGTGLSAATDGSITGTPAAVGTISATIAVSDDTGRSSQVVETITVLPPVTVDDAPSSSVVYNHATPTGSAPVAHDTEGAVSWSLASGSPPTGMSVDPSTGRIVGRAKQLGDFGPIFVKAVDDLGGAAVSKIGTTIHVTMNDDPIELSVTDYMTHVGALIATSALGYDNNLGSVTFFSDDASSLGLNIDPATGAITGRIAANTDAFVNVSVRDADTSRVTSKPLHLMVLPALRITVPSTISVLQGTAVNQTAATAFKAGAVAYEKVGTWPAGLGVDPSTGAITGTTSDAVATYGGLTIKGTDTFGGGQKDVESSNVFSIRVGPTDAKPVISAVNSTPATKAQLYTVGTAMTFQPVVVDDKQGQPWTYAGTVYRLNHDVKADTGLDFDASTGVISGTATKPVIYKDLTITVTSARGDSSTTPAYWFGVQPKDPIQPTAAELLALNTYVRVPNGYASTAPAFDNSYGTLKYTLGVTPGSNSFSTTTGILSNTATATTDYGDWPAPVTVTDEFGRTGTTPRRLVVLPALSVSAPDVAVDTTNPVTITATPTGLQGAATYNWSGLPAGLAPSAAGNTVVGTLSTSAAGDVWSVTVTVSDSKDGATASKTIKLTKADPSKWRIVFSSWIPHPSVGMNCFGLADLKIFNGSSDITSSSAVTTTGESAGYETSKLVDGTTSSMWFQLNALTVPPVISMTTTKPVTSMTFYFRQDGASACMPSSWTVQQASASGATWLNSWSETISPVANNLPYTTKPK